MFYLIYIKVYVEYKLVSEINAIPRDRERERDRQAQGIARGCFTSRASVASTAAASSCAGDPDTTACCCCWFGLRKPVSERVSVSVCN